MTEYEEPLFRKLVEDGEIERGSIEQWVQESEIYQRGDEVVLGMHIGPCVTANETCCSECDGHAVAMRVEDGDATEIGCTNSDCDGPDLA